MGAAPGGTGAPGSLTAGSWLHPQHPTRSPQSPETGRPAFAGDSRSVLSPPAPTGCRGSAPSRQVTPALVARGDCPDQSCGQGPCLGHPLPPPTPPLLCQDPGFLIGQSIPELFGDLCLLLFPFKRTADIRRHGKRRDHMPTEFQIKAMPSHSWSIRMASV